MDDLYPQLIKRASFRNRHGRPASVGESSKLPIEWLGGVDGAAPVEPLEGLLPQYQLEALEAMAAESFSLDGSLMGSAPLSYYQRVLRETRGAWDEVIVVGDTSLAQAPLFLELFKEFNASFQSGSPSLDIAVLMLARQLILSSGSTFSFSAAALGRARVIHAPHVAGLMHVHPSSMGCFVTPSALDDRWVYHDVFRAGLGRVVRGYKQQIKAAQLEGLTQSTRVTRDWALEASKGVWTDHLEWLQQPLANPLPSWDDECPEDDPDELGAEGLARALGNPPPITPQDQSSKRKSMPLYFLTYHELVQYYRTPACMRFLMPSVSRTQETSDINYRWQTCPDNAYMAPLKEAGYSGKNCRVDEQWAQPCEG